MQYVAVKCLRFEGIPCRHVICALKQEKIAHLPQHYILKRWTRHAQEGSVYDSNGVEIRAVFVDSLIGRHAYLKILVNLIIKEALLSRKALEYVEASFAKMHLKIKEINSNKETSNGKKEKNKDDV